MIEDLRPLKDALLTEYGSFADGRIKNIDRGDRFIVDDRTDRDYAADGQPFSWFCTMYVTVKSPDDLEMWVENTLPMSASVERWLSEMGAGTYANGFRFKITSENYGRLRILQGALNAIVQRRYDVPAYKYVVPRTANSLERLFKALSSHWGN